MVTEFNIPLLVSSDPINGAYSVSSGGDYFETDLKRPISIPKKATNCVIEVVNAQIPWTVINISSSNNKFRLNYSTDGKTITNYDITLPDGLYDISLLNSTVSRLLTNLSSTLQNIVTISGNYATNHSTFNLSDQYYQIEWVASSFYTLMGCTLNQTIPNAAFTTGNYYEDSPAVATFGDVSGFLVHSDIIKVGINYASYSNILADVLINVRPGSLINYLPYNPLKLDASELIGADLKHLRFWITDQKNRSVNLNGEYWSTLLNIKYFIK
jgi:hypothetical protein